MGKYFTNNCLPNASNLGCPDYTKKREAHYIIYMRGGIEMFGQDGAVCESTGGGVEREARSWTFSWLFETRFEWRFTFLHPLPWCIAEAKGHELVCRTLTASLSCFSNETPGQPSPRSPSNTPPRRASRFLSPKQSTCQDPQKVRRRLPMISSLKSCQLASGPRVKNSKGRGRGRGENTFLNIDKRSGDYRRSARSFICNRNTACQSYSSERYTVVIIYKTPCRSV